MTLHYIAEYVDEKDRHLSFSPAGVTKMKYIISSIKEVGVCVKIFSTSRTKDKNKYYPIKVFNIDENESVIYRSTLNFNNKVIFYIDRCFCLLQLLFYFILFVKPSDNVFVYHELYYQPFLNFMKLIFRFKLIYEVEELYTVAACYNEKRINKEISILRKADAFIFSTILLEDKINCFNKPFSVVSGIYNSYSVKRNEINDNKIHIVYAGTLNVLKGGAELAIRTAQYLDGKYHLHILGFGNEKEIKEVNDLIHKISSISQSMISYHGLLIGDEYKSFLQCCQIGLSTQQLDGKFNDTSFPSKVLVYLANGLHVIAPRIKALETSDVWDVINYYPSNDPLLIAETIKKINIDINYDYSNRIKNLHDNFLSFLKRICI